MKQGQAAHSGMGATKVEPKSMGISPGAVSRIGNAQSETTKAEPIHQGRGLKAPMVGCTTHKSGSQGRHD
jgi:hypothetical protein